VDAFNPAACSRHLPARVAGGGKRLTQGTTEKNSDATGFPALAGRFLISGSQLEIPMTHRERILAAIRGEIPDGLPWVPRLEFWHRARLRHGTLPPELRSLTLTQIADRLGVGCYDSIPD